jgi:hypothetical protein
VAVRGQDGACRLDQISTAKLPYIDVEGAASVASGWSVRTSRTKLDVGSYALAAPDSVHACGRYSRVVRRVRLRGQRFLAASWRGRVRAPVRGQQAGSGMRVRRPDARSVDRPRRGKRR